MLTPSAKSDPGRRFASPGEALACLLGRLAPVATETLPLGDASGRVVAESITADRPHPAADLSAMDGYAVRVADARGEVPVCGEVETGRAPPPLARGAAMRIFTGGALPEGAETVIRREDLAESPDRIVVPDDLRVKTGQNIRYRGENAEQGAVVVRAGTVLSPARICAAAAFGRNQVRVYRTVRVAVMVTGNEVVGNGELAATEIVDANGPAVVGLLEQVPFATITEVAHVADDLHETREVLARLVDGADAVLVTGGVSMGDHDYVPAAAASVAEIVFHGLPIRPGRPMLAAVRDDGRLILGLPGNPLSVMTAARRFGLAAIGRRAGLEARPPVPAVRLVEPDGRTLRLWWYRPVVLVDDGTAALVPSKGSGDVVSAAASDGFIELPPGADGEGPWPFYRWGMEG